MDNNDGHYIVQDWSEAIVEISDQYLLTYLRTAKDFVTRKWHKIPVETTADWQAMKQRYRPDSPGRLPTDFFSIVETWPLGIIPYPWHFLGPSGSFVSG